MMDRDNRFERVKKAYDMLVNMNADKYDYPEQAWENNQARGITDEFINPSIINRDGIIEDNDSIITFNFRPDRLRELYAALTNKDFAYLRVEFLEHGLRICPLTKSDLMVIQLILNFIIHKGKT